MSARSEVIALLDDIPALGQRNYADRAPAGSTLPYTVVKPRIVGRTPALEAAGRAMYWRDQDQIDLWQRLSAEDGDLLDEVCAALDGVKLTAGLRLRVRSSVRVPEETDEHDLVHEAITITYVKPA